MINKVNKKLSLFMLLGAILLLSGCPPRSDKVYPVAEEEYLLGWVLHNINDLTPTDVSYSESELAVYNYTYNYPDGSPNVNDNVLFWFAPFQNAVAASWTRLAVPESRVYYLKGDEVSNPIYSHGWSFSNYMQINYITSEDSYTQFNLDVAHQEHYKSENAFSAVTPVPGEKEHIYFGTSPFTPASIIVSNEKVMYNEKGNNVIRLNDKLLRGYNGKSYLNRITSFLIFNNNEWSRINLLPQPTYKVHRIIGSIRGFNVYPNKVLLAEGNLTDYYGNWDNNRVFYALNGIGRYSVDVEIPSDYPVFNITRISAEFSYQGNAIELPILKHIEFPAGFRINEILPISVEFENENAINNVLMYYKTEVMQDWAFLANSRNAELLITDTNAKKIDFKFTAATAYGIVTYEIYPISLRKINIECPTSESKYSSSVIRGKCIDNNQNSIEGIKLELYSNGGYLGAAMTNNLGDYEFSVEQKVGRADVRFKGTGSLVQKPSISVVSPNGGEVWQIGSNQTILWESKGVPPTSSIDIIRLRDHKTRREFELIESTVNDGIEEITVPDLPSGYYSLEINTSLDGQSISDQSDFPFNISRPIKCTDSDGGIDLYTKGFATGDNGYGQIITIYDKCVERTSANSIKEVKSCYGDKCAQEEALCSGNLVAVNSPSGIGNPCPNGCKDGACLKSCPELPPEECLRYSNCQIVKTRKQPDRCEIKPCSKILAAECLNYDHCQLISVRKQGQKCAEKT